MEALAYVASLSNYPNAEMQPGKFFAAFRHKQQMLQYARISGTEVWESMGPANVGGRTLCLAFHPLDTAVLYMGSASGGLWKSVTGGTGLDAWTYVETGFPVLGVSSIVFNPEDPNEMFIGTGETYSYGSTTHGLVTRTERGSFGMGILHSTDGGVTWEMSLDWTYQENRGIWDIVFSPANSDILIAATTEGIYRTTDGGVNWVQTLDKKMVMDISVHPDQPDLLFAGIGNLSSAGKGIYRSEDGGATWEILTGGGLPAYTHDGRISVHQWAGDPQQVIAVISNALSTVGIYRSYDGGDTWAQLDDEEVMSYQGWFAKGTLVHPEDDKDMLFGGVELWKTTNGGASIIQMTTYIGPSSELHPDIHDIVCNPLDPDKVYILTDGGLFRSNDFGESYYSCNYGYVTSQFYIGSISAQTDEKGLGGLQDNFTQRYDGDPYWTAVIGGDGAANAIDYTDDNIQYGSYQYGNFYQSTDGGVSFWDYIFGPTGASAFVAPFLIAPDHEVVADNAEVLFTGDTRLWRSDNLGASFYKPNPEQADTGNVLMAIGAGYDGTDTIYFSTAGVAGRADMFRSTNGGETLTCITNGLPDRYYRDIAVHPLNADIVYVTLSGFGSGHIYRSDNGGNTWTDISTALPDIPFHTIVIDPAFPDVVYAGGDMGVYVSDNGGETWNIYGTGMPAAVLVFDLAISPSDEKLIAYTHGNGAYRIPLWREENVSVANSTGIDCAVYPTVTNGPLHISFDPPAGNYRITCCSMVGEIVFTERVSVSDVCTLNVAQLPQGNYYLTISDGVHTATKRFVKM